MKFSLLYKIPEDTDYDARKDMHDAIYNLNLDRAINAVCDNQQRADTFINVLMNPCSKVENIIYRQELINDFTKQPQLLVELKRLFRRYDTISTDWNEMRSNVHPYGASVSFRALMEYTFDLLKVSSKFAKMIAGYFRSTYEILDKYKVSAPGLTAIKDYCVEMINNDSLKEIVDIATKFTLYAPDQYEFTVLARMDDTLRVRACTLTNVIGIEKIAKERSLWNVIKNVRKRGEKAPEFNLGDNLGDDANFFLNEALFRMYTVMTEVAEHVYEVFYGLSNELTFYEGALDYINFLSQSGMTTCVPHLRRRESDVFNADGLFDMLLLVEGKGKDEIITNSVRLSGKQNGLMIRGNNSTGKTVYLRSIGTAQLMAQSGLPVCARRASVSLRSAIFTQFSSAEKDFVVGDTAGRFEGEVQEVAHIVESIKPYSLILLNETFQTTSYEEGSAGMFDILSVFPKLNAKYVFVTRMTKLFEMAEDAPIKRMESGEGNDRYKIRPLAVENQE